MSWLLFLLAAAEPADCADYVSLVRLSVRYARAEDAFARGHHDDGIRLLSELVRDDARFSLAHWRIAKNEDERGDTANAYTAYRRYLAGPCSAFAVAATQARLRFLESRQVWLADYARAERDYESGDYIRALTVVRQVVREKPTFALAHRLLALTSSKLKASDDARQAAAAYAKLDPLATDLAVVQQAADTK